MLLFLKICYNFNGEYMHINIDGKDYKVIINRKNNKRTYIRVKDDLNIYVYTSKYYMNFEVEKIVFDNILNIKKMIETVNKKKLNSDKNMYLGNEIDIVCVSNQGYPEIYNNKLYIKDINKLNDYYNMLAIDYFKSRLDIIYPRFLENIPYPILKVRKMKSRYGVCNRKSNSITINSELIKMDKKFIDYVIIHELCHFVYFDHSSDFWNKVSEYCPEYKSIKKEMREW